MTNMETLVWLARMRGVFDNVPSIDEVLPKLPEDDAKELLSLLYCKESAEQAFNRMKMLKNNKTTLREVSHDGI